MTRTCSLTRRDLSLFVIRRTYCMSLRVHVGLSSDVSISQLQ